MDILSNDYGRNWYLNRGKGFYLIEEEQLELMVSKNGLLFALSRVDILTNQGCSVKERLSTGRETANS